MDLGDPLDSITETVILIEIGLGWGGDGGGEFSN